MSWNEPGGNKKDPWSGRDQQETPPDLEEVMRSLQEKLGGLFGGGVQASEKAEIQKKREFYCCHSAWPSGRLTGIYIVDEGNRGVVTRFGKYVETTQPGPHWRLPAPIESHAIVNVEQQRFIEVGYRSQYSPANPAIRCQGSLDADPRRKHHQSEFVRPISNQGRKNYSLNCATIPCLTLEKVTESAERGVIGKNTMDFVLTEGTQPFSPTE